MGTDAETTDQRERRSPLDVIRVETALSRFPVHRLAKAGTVRIDLREADDAGAVTLRWEVSHNSKYGQPGPLAYKLDTLVINRKIEAAGRPLPRIIRLGSLKEIAQELGLGGDTSKAKKALYQNASAFITAKLKYRAADGSERAVEIGDTRYAVVLTGETLPDGRAADAVYIVPHDFFRDVLGQAPTRPLDYDYLRDLPPVPQRWYELASYQMFAALKHGRPKARMSYAEFCAHAPQTRYVEYDRVKRQMYKVHAPHRKAGYIADVAFEATTDRQGRPDWMMSYTPGPKARAEFRAFTQRGRVELVVEVPEPLPEPEPTGLAKELIDRGITQAVAVELVGTFPEDRIRAQIERVDWLRAKKPKKLGDPAAYLVGAIREDYAPPAGYRVKIEQDQAEQGATQAQATRVRERAEQDRIKAFWEGLGPAERERIESEALAIADPEERAALEKAGSPTMRRLLMVPVREAYIRGLLGLAPTG